MTREDGNYPATGRCTSGTEPLRRLDTFSGGAKQLGTKKQAAIQINAQDPEFQGRKSVTCVFFIIVLFDHLPMDVSPFQM
jgi:hypothetical protein